MIVLSPISPSSSLLSLQLLASALTDQAKPDPSLPREFVLLQLRVNYSPLAQEENEKSKAIISRSKNTSQTPPAAEISKEKGYC